MQVDPIKPTLKAPGTQRLKLKYDKLLSSFAFNFNLRRYNTESDHLFHLNYAVTLFNASEVGRCRFTASKPVLKLVRAYGGCNQRLKKLEYHKLLSTFAFEFNLRRYSEGDKARSQFEAGRCWLTLSNPR